MVVCKLFPYTFETQTMISWDKFETCFLEKIGDDKSPEVLFNQIFFMLKNKILADSMPAEILFVAYYAKALHNNIAIWVKRSKKNMLLEDFEEASQIEKDILSLKDNLSSEAETTSSSKNKIEILTRPPQTKNQQETLDLERLHKAFQKPSNQVVELKISAEEVSIRKGSFKPPFINYFPPNRPNSTT
jgi:hypothetical protein